MEPPIDFRTPVAELTAAAGAAELGFLGIGQTLEQAIGILARQADKVGTLRAGMDSAALTGAIDALRRSAEAIAALAGRHDAEQASLDRLAAIAAAVHDRIATMQALTREVDVLALNARLLAAGMGESGADFMTFAGEIRRVAQTAVGHLAQIGAELAGAGQHLQAAHAAIADFSSRHRDAIATIPARLAANIAQVETRGRLALAGAAQVAARSEDISRQVAAQITALQFGDISRQRIEHVRDAALTLAEAGPAATDALRSLGSRLLAAHLRDTAAEIDTKTEAIIAGLVGLAAAARDIRRISGQAYGASDRQVGSFVAELESDVRQSQALVASLCQADTAMAERAGAMLEAMHRLVRHVATVRTVEADMRIIGLNTTLKCSRLGTIGRPLSVVAQELRGFGAQTSAQAASVMKALDEMTRLAASLGAADRTRRHGGLEATAAGMDQATATLHGLGEMLSDALAALETDSDQVAGLLDEAAAWVAGWNEIRTVLRRIAAGFDAVSRDADEAVGAVDERGRHVLATIAASYTMARERDVHASVVPWAEATPAIVAAASVELEDMLF